MPVVWALGPKPRLRSVPVRVPVPVPVPYRLRAVEAYFEMNFRKLRKMWTRRDLHHHISHKTWKLEVVLG